MPSDDVYRQIGYLADRLTDAEANMIDPVAFGEVKGRLQGLKTELDDLKVKQATMDEKLDLVLDKLSEAKGGWRLLMALGGAAATLGGAITWFMTHSITIGPKP